MKAHEVLKWVGTTLVLGVSLLLSIVLQPGSGRVLPPQEDDGLYGVEDLQNEFAGIKRLPLEVFQVFGEALSLHRQGNLKRSLNEGSELAPNEYFQEALKRYQQLQNVLVDGEPVNLVEISVVVAHNVAMLYRSVGEVELARQFMEWSEYLNSLRES